MIVNDHVPHALRGVILAGFLAAFMSTIATQLNWGSSYLVVDFYRRFLRRNETEKHYVHVSQIVTLLLVVAAGYVSAQLSSIRTGWQVVLELSAGSCSVYLLRWYWWRINAWSEISAMATSLCVAVLLRWDAFWTAVLHRPHLFEGSSTVVFAKSGLTTTLVTTIVWIAVTFLTRPEPEATLESFYRKARPDATGWQRIAAQAHDVPQTRDLGANTRRWVIGCVMVYCALFGVGKLLLGHPALGSVLAVISIACAFELWRELR